MIINYCLLVLLFYILYFSLAQFHTFLLFLLHCFYVRLLLHLGLSITLRYFSLSRSTLTLSRLFLSGLVFRDTLNLSRLFLSGLVFWDTLTLSRLFLSGLVLRDTLTVNRFFLSRLILRYTLILLASIETI